MTTNETTPPIPMVEDMLDTLKITSIEDRTRAGANGVWVSGTIEGHRFNALVFETHASDPGYELGDSRISKFWLQRLDDKTIVVNFDRGWDLAPATPMAQQITDLLCEGLADLVYAVNDQS